MDTARPDEDKLEEAVKEFVKEMIDNGDVDGDGEIDKDEMF